MGVTVVGSVAFDALETPFGKRERILGGAATHFALGASFFTDVRVVGVVGDDFGADEFAVFQSRGINVDDVEQIAGESSFFWAGRYDHDMQVAQTIDTQLNVFADFDPVLSAGARESSVTFLANIQPDLQRRVREQCSGAVVTGLDSMNYWIESARESLLQTIACVDVVSLNDTEVRMLTGQPNLARAAREICALGPRVLVVKQGVYGACMFSESGFFFVPGLSTRDGRRPHRRGRLVRGGLLRLPRQPARGRRGRRRGAPACRGLRLGDRVVRDRGLRQRAVAEPDPAARSRPASGSSSR